MNKENQLKQIKSNWETFKTLFLLVIGVILVVRFIATASENNYYIFFTLDILIKLFMAYHVGKYAYLFSRKKQYILVGFLGFIWLGFIGPIIAYFIVQKIKNNQVKGLN